MKFWLVETRWRMAFSASRQYSRRDPRVLNVRAASAFIGLLMGGCVPFSDTIWQPEVAGAVKIDAHTCDVGEAKEIELNLAGGVKLRLQPETSKNPHTVVFHFYVPRNTVVRFASRQAAIESLNRSVSVQLAYVGMPAADRRHELKAPYELKGNYQPGYTFRIPLDATNIEDFLLVLPDVFVDDHDVGQLRIPFKRHHIFGIAGALCS